MAQFDVHEVPVDSGFSLVVDLQASGLGVIDTRVVAPIMRTSSYRAPLSTLTPLVDIDGREHVVVTPQLGAIPVTMLGRRLGSIAGYRDELVRALDRIFTGI